MSHRNTHNLSLQLDDQENSIQTIALMLSEPRSKPSLVVAPVVALMQWKHEIETHAAGFTVALWHGQSRVNTAELKKYDVVSDTPISGPCALMYMLRCLSHMAL